MRKNLILLIVFQICVLSSLTVSSAYSDGEWNCEQRGGGCREVKCKLTGTNCVGEARDCDHCEGECWDRETGQFSWVYELCTPLAPE